MLTKRFVHEYYMSEQKHVKNEEICSKNIYRQTNNFKKKQDKET